jgi:hypothetical protein
MDCEKAETQKSMKIQNENPLNARENGNIAIWNPSEIGQVLAGAGL